MYAQVAGFIGLALGALRGLKAGPKEITIVSTFMPIMHGIRLTYSNVGILFFHLKVPFGYAPIHLWINMLFGLVMGLSTALILAKVVASYIRKRQIPWAYLHRLSGIALVAAVVLTADAILYSPKTCRIDSLFVVGLMYWMITCWIRHETCLSACGEVTDTSSRLLPQDFVVLRKIAIAVLILAGALVVFLLATSFYGVYYVSVVFRYLVVFLLVAALLIDGKERLNRSDTMYQPDAAHRGKIYLRTNKLFTLSALVYLASLTVILAGNLTHIIMSIFQMGL